MTAEPLNQGRGRVLRKHFHHWNEPGEAALEQEVMEPGPGYPPSCLVMVLTKKSTCFFQQTLFAGPILLLLTLPTVFPELDKGKKHFTFIKHFLKVIRALTLSTHLASLYRGIFERPGSAEVLAIQP